ncbi:MAG: hypothetical protein QMD09_07400 [Desulfatibacillaceae bacterium]|nr:hypothetical protein [Desulfatibacillaceae bacterium]
MNSPGFVLSALPCPASGKPFEAGQTHLGLATTNEWAFQGRHLRLTAVREENAAVLLGIHVGRCRKQGFLIRKQPVFILDSKLALE